jgi:hypothetical protein
MSNASHPQHESHNDGSHYQPSLAVVLVILVLFVAATFLMLKSTHSSNPSTTSTTLASSTTNSNSSTSSTVVPKSRVRVQIANGTSTTGLARTYTQQLMTYGWDTLPQVNASKVSATVIYYNPGYLWAAKQLASEIKVGDSAIQPLNGLSPVSGASNDDVIIILGPDVATRG